MSADLLAAFGINDPDTTKLSPANNQVTPRPDPWRLASQPRETLERKVPLWEQDGEGKSVLFDAAIGDQADEDDFGDFENAQNPEGYRHAAPQPQIPSLDLLNLDEQSTIQHQNSDYPESTTASIRPVSDPFDVFNDAFSHRQPVSAELQVANNAEDDWGDFEDVKQAQNIPTIQSDMSSKSAKASQGHDDALDTEEWDSFEDGPISKQGENPEVAKVESMVSSKNPGTTPTGSSQNMDISRERPLNIPPPYSLLQLLTLAVQKTSSQSKSRMLEPDLTIVANGIVSLYRTTSRIVAGRTYRWKRDTILAQSMRISEVNQKSTGMKLTALDRSETIKEEQEAIEAITAWTKYNHVLNSILLKAKVQKPAMSLKADMKVRALAGPGILNERESCAICGLKRNERIIGIDIKIDDVFEEFWIEHWGHTDCNTFWTKFKILLGQR